MSFILKKGKVRFEYLPIAASLALIKGTLVEHGTATAGTIAAADADEAAESIAGVLAQTIATTDADYATAKTVAVMVPKDKHCIWEVDTADTYVEATHCGLEVGLADSANVDLDEVSADCFHVTGPGSTTLKVRGYLKINGSY